MAEGISLPAALDGEAEVFAEVAQADLVVAAEHLALEQVGVGLDPGPADDLPPAGADHGLDAGVGRGIGAAHMLVDRGLAADEGQVGLGVQQVEHRPAGGHALVEALAGIPEPDGIEMGVGDDVDDGFFHGEEKGRVLTANGREFTRRASFRNFLPRITRMTRINPEPPDTEGLF